ncbi:unnamed protein product [Brassicogethes aeneus]|uniref:Uncharacterized protein n=1 Tax=Brassicogethes aeneus TaxID=1431903 RepID=A0A9P0B1F8_BRAAE|nr:unnamed protein product [Brassicogethes aeneus]
MIKFPILDNEGKKFRQTTTTKFITLEEAVTLPTVINFEGGGISSGATINELGKQLLKAAAEGDATEIKYLLMKGAPFTADWLGTSPLHVAAQNNSVEVCEILLRAGISKDARTKVDRTPLHIAAYEGHIDIVNTLLKHGADFECKDLLAMTPLHWAVQNGHAEVVKILIEKGCCTTEQNKFNLTPMDIASQLNREDLLELLNCDASIAAQNLALQLAAESGENSNASEYQTGLLENSEAVPIETVLLEDDSMGLETHCEEGPSLNEDHLESQISESNVSTQESSFSASMKILQDHGITMLPHDDNTILSTVMESGHSVVLTDIGKEVLDSVKQSEEAVTENKKIITITAEEFLAMTNGTYGKTSIRPFKLVNCKKTGKKIMVKRNKILPISNVSQVTKVEEYKPTYNDMELVMSQLIEAKKTIEEYKAKLVRKEKEAERYKQQLKLLMDSS